MNMLRKQSKRYGFVYIFVINEEDKRLYKIGRSYNPRKRLEQLKIDYPDIFEYGCIPTYDDVDLEHAIHYLYSAYRVRGEWFDLPPGESVYYNCADHILSQSAEDHLRHYDFTVYWKAVHSLLPSKGVIAYQVPNQTAG